MRFYLGKEKTPERFTDSNKSTEFLVKTAKREMDLKSQYSNIQLKPQISLVNFKLNLMNRNKNLDIDQFDH